MYSDKEKYKRAQNGRKKLDREVSDQLSEESAHQHSNCNSIVDDKPFNKVRREERTIQDIQKKVESSNDLGKAS